MCFSSAFFVVARAQIINIRQNPGSSRAERTKILLNALYFLAFSRARHCEFLLDVRIFKVHQEQDEKLQKQIKRESKTKPYFTRKLWKELEPTIKRNPRKNTPHPIGLYSNI